MRKIFLTEKDMPRAWYNIQADMPSPLPPPLNPETGEPITPDMLSPIFPMNLIEQEVSTERWIDIPEEVLERLFMWRPSPLCRATSLEKFLGTPAHIYYKNEGMSPPGSHKPNTSIAQAYYNKVAGIKRLTTETGAGQWGSALAFACNQFGLELKVYMVRVSYNQKPYRRMMMEAWGSKCIPSPSPDTNAGRKFLEENPDHTGSLGIAISEAIEDAVTSKDTKYALGSVLNHVMMHPAPIHAGGLRYHGMAPLVSKLFMDGLIEAKAYNQLETFAAGIIFARTEGFIPAPETNHAIACAIEEAKRAKEEGKERVILMNFSGQGIIDLPSYDAYLSGKLQDYTLPNEEIQLLLKELEKYPRPK